MSTSQTIKGKVLFDYSATEEDELSLSQGDYVQVLETYDDGWWLIKKGTLLGLAPSNYIDVVSSMQSIDLPIGWRAAIDQESNQEYYYNETTGIPIFFLLKQSLRNHFIGLVQWEHPALYVARSAQMEESMSPEKKRSKNDFQSSTDLRRVKELRQEADQKINALR
jgi:hypothetical protein